MQTDNKILDDLAKLANAAAGGFMDIKREIEASVRAQVEQLLLKMNLVRREEFEVVREMAQKARLEQEKMQTRLAQIEKMLESKESASGKSAAKK